MLKGASRMKKASYILANLVAGASLWALIGHAITVFLSTHQSLTLIIVFFPLGVVFDTIRSIAGVSLLATEIVFFLAMIAVIALKAETEA